ncbi:hypothetical protein HELRODRAFT_68674 [Helobdella robusta]|uniref:C3H1-type domain-containing protein n=1 Tax=Helobdella robusta TaxID=6412 RepID=T1FZI1_HELRO|nr:hypothetical protein HELRODRAFT_68674 [Helobdella robusta]ESN94508.1 hypothetical protein HELRODRAFT_68674 [Helobdella robusta]
MNVKKQLRPLPVRCPINNIFLICWNVQRGHCSYPNCQFAHCKEEKEMWQWMNENNMADIFTFEEKIDAVKRNVVTSSTSAIRFAWNLPQLVSQPAAIPMKEQFYCFYCDKTFSGKKQQKDHNNSLKHLENIRRDDDFQWNFRTPPLTSVFKLCEKSNFCLYSGVPMEYNFCTSAHGQNELDEWLLRQKWKNKKWKKAEQDHLISVACELKQEIKAADEITEIVINIC